MDCIFCKIAKKEIPADIIYEDKNVIAFLDIHPLNKGHTLIIPKKHARWVWGVENFGEYSEVAKKVAKALQKAMKTEYIAMGVAGNEIPHAHIHLVPRFEDDGHGGWLKVENTKKISEEEMKKIAQEIRKFIK